jgi:hypothetical protein
MPDGYRDHSKGNSSWIAAARFLQRNNGLSGLLLMETEVLIQDHLRDRQHVTAAVSQLAQKAQERTIRRPAWYLPACQELHR